MWGMAPFILQNGAVRVSVLWVGQEPFDNTTLWSHATVWRSEKEKKNIYIYKIYICTHTQTHMALSSPCCDLNLFCLEYEYLLGSWCTLREQADSIIYIYCFEHMHGKDADRQRRVRIWKIKHHKDRLLVCMCFEDCESQVNFAHIHKF